MHGRKTRRYEEEGWSGFTYKAVRTAERRQK
jgi:hypothetical protein